MHAMRALAVLGCVLAVAGCGDSGAEQAAPTQAPPTYEEQMRLVVFEIQRDTENAAAQLSAKGTSPTVVSATLTALGNEIGKSAATAQEIEPPVDVAQAHARYARALGRLGDEVRALARRIRTPRDLQRGFDVGRLPAAADVERAGRAIAAAGYAIDPGAA